MCDLTKDFTTKNNLVVSITIDDDGEEICVKDKSGSEIGKIRFSREEYDDDYSHHERYKIVWMYLDKQEGTYLHQGIGRECLKFHKSIFQSPITSSDNDGVRRDDGSHLTGNAPAFVARMKEEGIISKSNEDYPQDDEG